MRHQMQSGSLATASSRLIIASAFRRARTEADSCRLPAAKLQNYRDFFSCTKRLLGRSSLFVRPPLQTFGSAQLGDGIAARGGEVNCPPGRNHCGVLPIVALDR